MVEVAQARDDCARIHE